MKLKFYVIIVLIIMTLTTNDMRAQNSTTGFSGKRVSRSATISLHGPLDKVFTLFEPEPERNGWLIHSCCYRKPRR
jgi:hypothetical protein